MNQLTQSIRIAAKPSAVWAVLKDLQGMQAYMPGIAEVRILSESSSGVGATRHCVFEDGIELTERAVEWNEGTGYTLETTSFKGVPMLSNRIAFTVAAIDEETLVEQSMQYQMKGWIFAPLVERMAAGMMRTAIQGALAGLKAHVER